MSEFSQSRPSSAHTDSSAWQGSAATATPVPPAAPSETYTATAERDSNLRYRDFFHSSHSPTVVPYVAQNIRLPARVAYQLRIARDSFAGQAKINNMGTTCCATDRAAVLAVYNEALEKIAEWEVQQEEPQIPFATSRNTSDGEDPERYNLLLQEVQTKTKIILGVVDAYPEDAAFGTTQMLSPLEPMYANPRIDLHDDNYRRLAAQRLKDWRAEGWPARFPAKAYAAEAEELLWDDYPDVASEERLGHRRKDWAVEDWGEEVDADHECWDKADWEKRQRQKDKKGGGKRMRRWNE
ncbi:hypothetical protein NX059_000898 [Plenodomus lindquistii]|nr:hypothetical protein NX059_000898 [Plenodomus lindquistii]